MPFGVVSGVGLGMGVLNFGGDRRSGRGRFGVNLGCPIVTNGDLLRRCDQAVVWRGEWSVHSCVRWNSTCLQGKGLFLAFFGIFATFFSMRK